MTWRNCKRDYDMAKIIKITTGEVACIITEEYASEAAANNGEAPNVTSVEITEIKPDHINWKKGEVENE